MNMNMLRNWKSPVLPVSSVAFMPKIPVKNERGSWSEISHIIIMV